MSYSHRKFYDRLMDQLIKRLDIENKVHSFPPQPYEKMPFFINASNVIAAPYDCKMFKNFTTPLKIIESLACARPVITCDVPEFRLWFKKGVIYYESYQEFYERLNELTNNSETVYEELLEYSDIIRKTYSWRNISRAYESIIEYLSERQDEPYGNLILFEQIVNEMYCKKKG